MRPNQQNNRRSRGRNNNNQQNNRRSPNPLTRSYESNGPDVKIRGNAQTVADKYLTLARDAHSAGDRVMAENYFQHAEHYNRIIATAQAQQAEQQAKRDQEQAEAAAANTSHDAHNSDKPSDEGKSAEPAQHVETQDPEGAPQPEISETPAEVNMEGEKPAAKKTERPRRTRRPRKTAEEKAAEAQTSEASETPPAEPVAQDGPSEKPSEAEEIVA